LIGLSLFEVMAGVIIKQEFKNDNERSRRYMLFAATGGAPVFRNQGNIFTFIPYSTIRATTFYESQIIEIHYISFRQMIQMTMFLRKSTYLSQRDRLGMIGGLAVLAKRICCLSYYHQSAELLSKALRPLAYPVGYA
jgi:hypothetical protein